MWNRTVEEDMELVGQADFVRWEMLAGKTVFITGATGLIGSTVINLLAYVNRTKKLNVKILALVRDEKRARARFSEFTEDEIDFILGNVENLPSIEMSVDFIIHGASQTSSTAFMNEPVETILTAICGTKNVLELARKKNVTGMVYLSSMEVYGHPERGHKVKEDDIGAMSPLDVRNSYPISKQQCESLCCAYAKEYQVSIMIARLTQTFGPGVNYSDNRIFAYFARCVREKEDIVLKTKGETERCYLYTADAATAILTILLSGNGGSAYNVANENTYCSIAQMAQQVADQGGIKVKFDIQDERVNGYPITIYMDLDTSELRSLGWKILIGDDLGMGGGNANV